MKLGHVLFAMLLTLVLVGYVVYPRFGSAPPRQLITALTQVDNFKTVLDAFKFDCGRYPSSAEGLQALVTRPPGIAPANWHGPYLEKVPIDPWGNSYTYQIPGTHNPSAFDVYFIDPDTRAKMGNWPR